MNDQSSDSNLETENSFQANDSDLDGVLDMFGADQLLELPLEPPVLPELEFKKFQFEDAVAGTGTYEGQCIQGTQKEHGFGQQNSRNGSHIGCWKRGKPNGLGSTKCTNGDRFHGQYERGQLKCGIITSKSGDTYEGEFLNGLRHGKGKYTY